MPKLFLFRAEVELEVCIKVVFVEATTYEIRRALDFFCNLQNVNCASSIV